MSILLLLFLRWITSTGLQIDFNMCISQKMSEIVYIVFCETFTIDGKIIDKEIYRINVLTH